jgi:hypothetical protein
MPKKPFVPVANDNAETRDEARDALARGKFMRDHLPDVRDGLTRLERVVLWQLSVLQEERKGRMVPTAQLYGRVVEHVNVSEEQFMRTLQRLIGTSIPK